MSVLVTTFSCGPGEEKTAEGRLMSKAYRLIGADSTRQPSRQVSRLA